MVVKKISAFKTIPAISLFLTFVTALCLLLVMGPATRPQTAHRPNLVLTILHTNDLHAHDETFDEKGHRVGGMPRIGYLIKSIKRRNPQALAIDAGDIFQGTPYFKFYQGETEVHLMNQAGYDIFTIGNHEFDSGPANLVKQLEQAKFQIISANIDASAVPELAKLIQPSVVRVIDGAKVGFVGAVTPDLEHTSLTLGGVKVKTCQSAGVADWICPIKQEVEKLHSQGVDKIILVTHCGVDADKELAESIPEVDAIIGGHSHTRLDQPLVINHPDGSTTTIVQTGSYGRTLGKLVLSFDNAGRVINSATQYHLINITDRIPEDPSMAAYLESKSQPVQAMRGNVLCQATGAFDNQFRRYSCDTSLCDLICDALAAAGTKYGATISFQNRGGTRAPIEEGPISMEKVEEVLPFDNHLILATISGQTVKSVLEHSVAGSRAAKFLEVHGLKLAYDLSRPDGQRIVFALAETAPGQWSPIDPNSSYKIAINDYNFSGGEAYAFTGASDVQKTKERLAELFADYLGKQHTVAPGQPSRICEVSDMLTVLRRGNSSFLHLQAPPGAVRASLYLGKSPGVSAISERITVPVSSPREIAANVAINSSGQYDWPLPLSAHADEGNWAVVLVKTKDGGSQWQTLASRPISLP